MGRNSRCEHMIRFCFSFNAFMKATNNSPNTAEVEAFVGENFAMQDELENATLVDWNENPGILQSIQDDSYRKWARKLNNIWRTLARKIKSDVSVNPQRYSLIYVNNTFIVPGGRFRGDHLYDNISSPRSFFSIFQGNTTAVRHITLSIDYFPKSAQ